MKPKLFQDVDGVLLVNEQIDGYLRLEHKGAEYWYSPETPGRMQELNRLFDIVWSSNGWRGSENKVLSPIFGLPTNLPLLDFQVDDHSSHDMQPAKLKAIEKASNGPCAICDDKMGAAVAAWAVGRVALLIETDSKIGMNAKQYSLLCAFGEMYGVAEDSTENKMLREFGFSSRLDNKSAEVAWLKLHGRNEKPFVDDCKRFLQAQVASIVTALGKYAPQEGRAITADDLFNPRSWDKKLTSLARPHLTRSIHAGALLAWERSKSLAPVEKSDWEMPAKDNGVLMQIPRPVMDRIQRQIDESLTKLIDSGAWGSVSDTTRQKLSFVLQEAVLDGDNTEQMTRRIQREMGGEWAGLRALKIARTETTASLNAGQLAVLDDLKEQGIINGSEWLATKDEHTRVAHWNADGQHADENGVFDIGGHPAKFPGDPDLPADQRIHCRCSIVSF